MRVYIFNAFHACSNGLNQIDDAAERERQLSLKICSDINRVLLLALRPTKSHLDQTELDIEPRHEAFWFVGGINPLLAVQRARKKLPFLRDTAMKPHDRAFQYQGQFGTMSSRRTP